MIVRTKREAFHCATILFNLALGNVIGRSVGKLAAAWPFAVRADDGRHADWRDLSRASAARSRCRICVLGCLCLDSAAWCVLRRSAVSARRRTRSWLGHRGDSAIFLFVIAAPIAATCRQSPTIMCSASLQAFAVACPASSTRLGLPRHTTSPLTPLTTAPSMPGRFLLCPTDQ